MLAYYTIDRFVSFSPNSAPLAVQRRASPSAERTEKAALGALRMSSTLRKGVGHPAGGGSNPIEPLSIGDIEGMVGAWKVGKVFDIAARKRERVGGGPMDTSDQITVENERGRVARLARPSAHVGSRIDRLERRRRDDLAARLQ